MHPRPVRSRRAPWLAAPVLVAVVLVASFTTARADASPAFALERSAGAPERAPAGSPRPMAGPYGAAVTITGHGYGHGYGLGQYGALGYAVDHGWSAAQILDHYYGGTVAGTASNAITSVRLQALDDGQTAIVQPAGLATLTYDPYHLRWRSIVIRDLAPAGQPPSYRVWARTDAAVCPAASANLDAPGSGWLLVGAAITPRVVVTTSASSLTTTDVNQLLATCEPSGTVRSYRGDLAAINGTAGENRTINVLPIETYLRGVVGSEMPNSWGTAGGGRGAQALRAQAVAARSYALVQNRYSYARTCDTQTCQVYAGAAQRSGVGGAVTRREYSTTDAAIAATAGVVRRVGNTSGAISSTMFSASTGGYTAPGAGFTPVVDDGDATSSNPYHTWTTSVPVSKIEAAFPTVGTLTLISVTSRNGLGDWGGRVLTMQVRGTQGQVSIDGDTFRRALGLRSNWFNIAAPCGGRQQPAVTGTVGTSAGLGFVAVVPTRLADTRYDGGGPVGAGCTLVVDATGRPAGATAAVVNLTTTSNLGGGYLIAYGCGTPQPVVSAAQLVPRLTRATTTEVTLGPSGSICVYSSTNAQVIVDLLGWLAPGGAPIASVARHTVLDTGAGARLAAGSVTTVTVAPGAAAASIDVGLWATVGTGYLTIYPCDAARPTSSVVNAPAAGQVSTNHVIVRLDGAGRFCVFTSTLAHVSIQVDALLKAGGATMTSGPPLRKVDSRYGLGTSGALVPNVERTVNVGQASSIVAVQATLAYPASAGSLQVYSCGGSAGLGVRASGRNLNAAGLVVVATDPAGNLCLRSSVATHVLIDLLSWT